VLVGPGMHWPKLNNSAKMVLEIHFLPSTKTFWKMPMCAAGPPNAVQPINMNARKMSPYVVSVAFAMLIVVLINNYFKME
jgi:hypothetical protein